VPSSCSCAPTTSCCCTAAAGVATRSLCPVAHPRCGAVLRAPGSPPFTSGRTRPGGTTVGGIAGARTGRCCHAQVSGGSGIEDVEASSTRSRTSVAAHARGEFSEFCGVTRTADGPAANDGTMHLHGVAPPVHCPLRCNSIGRAFCCPADATACRPTQPGIRLVLEAATQTDQKHSGGAADGCAAPPG